MLLVEDHEILAESLSLALSGRGLEVSIAPLTRPAEVVDFAAATKPDVALLDFDLGDLGTGLQFIGPLNDLGADVVVVSGSADRQQLAACVEAGAAGYILKSQAFEDLVEAVVEVSALHKLLSPAQRADLLQELRHQRSSDHRRLVLFERLTAREQEALEALQRGESADEIATRWVVSLTTVRSHIKSLLHKLGVKSQLAAVALAREVGWVPAGDTRPTGAAATPARIPPRPLRSARRPRHTSGD